MLFCSESDLTQYVLQEYLTVIEDKNPGSIARHITSVSAEITEAVLQGSFTLPEINTSATLTRICSVMVCWRSIGEITSLMSSEASSNNEWLPLQRLNTRAEKDLDSIRSGKLDPFPEAAGDGGISVTAPAAMFGNSVWEKF